MNRKILMLFALCSCILLLAQRTLAQELDLTVSDNGERIKAAADFEKGIEDESMVKNSEAYATLSAPLELNFIESRGDSTSDFEILAMQTEVDDTELKDNATKIEEDNVIKVIEEAEPSATTLYSKLLQSEISPSTLTETYFATADEDKHYFTEITPQSADDLRISSARNVNTEREFESANVNDNDGKSAMEATEAIEDKVIEFAASSDAELTTIDIGETVTDALCASDETQLNGDSNERITTDVTTVELMKLNDALTTETPVAISVCTAPGSFADDSDCRSYFICSKAITNELQRVQKSCPPEQAFDKTRLHCSRNLSPCADAFVCKAYGKFADSNDNSSYYWCVASRLNDGYQIYHVQCGPGQIYTPALGKCFTDMNNLQDMPLNYDMQKSADEEFVRREVNIVKAEEKAKLKEVKLREKMQRKYEKDLLKKAAKEAKEQAKLQRESSNGEGTFNCAQEGSFAAAGGNFYDYFLCLSKKDKYKAVGMKCSRGQSFSAAKGFCTL